MQKDAPFSVASTTTEERRRLVPTRRSPATQPHAVVVPSAHASATSYPPPTASQTSTDGGGVGTDRVRQALFDARVGSSSGSSGVCSAVISGHQAAVSVSVGPPVPSPSVIPEETPADPQRLFQLLRRRKKAPHAMGAVQTPLHSAPPPPTTYAAPLPLQQQQATSNNASITTLSSSSATAGMSTSSTHSLFTSGLVGAGSGGGFAFAPSSSANGHLQMQLGPLPPSDSAPPLAVSSARGIPTTPGSGSDGRSDAPIAARPVFSARPFSPDRPPTTQFGSRDRGERDVHSAQPIGLNGRPFTRQKHPKKSLDLFGPSSPSPGSGGGWLGSSSVGTLPSSSLPSSSPTHHDDSDPFPRPNNGSTAHVSLRKSSGTKLLHSQQQQQLMGSSSTSHQLQAGSSGSTSLHQPGGPLSTSANSGGNGPAGGSGAAAMGGSGGVRAAAAAAGVNFNCLFFKSEDELSDEPFPQHPHRPANIPLIETDWFSPSSWEQLPTTDGAPQQHDEDLGPEGGSSEDHEAGNLYAESLYELLVASKRRPVAR